MKKLSLKKVSVLGVVLLAASAITAAVIPSASKPYQTLDGGCVDDDAVTPGNQFTCTNAVARASCDVTNDAQNFSDTENGTAVTTATVAGNPETQGC